MLVRLIDLNCSLKVFEIPLNVLSENFRNVPSVLSENIFDISALPVIPNVVFNFIILNGKFLVSRYDNLNCLLKTIFEMEEVILMVWPEEPLTYILILLIFAKYVQGVQNLSFIMRKFNLPKLNFLKCNVLIFISYSDARLNSVLIYISFPYTYLKLF